MKKKRNGAASGERSLHEREGIELVHEIGRAHV